MMRTKKERKQNEENKKRKKTMMKRIKKKENVKRGKKKYNADYNTDINQTICLAKIQCIKGFQIQPRKKCLLHICQTIEPSGFDLLQKLCIIAIKMI